MPGSLALGLTPRRRTLHDGRGQANVRARARTPSTAAASAAIETPRRTDSPIPRPSRSNATLPGTRFPIRDPRSAVSDYFAEVLLDDPVRLPLIGLACGARQIDCWRLPVRGGYRCRITEPRLPRAHQLLQARDVTGVLGPLDEVGHLMRIGAQVEQLQVSERRIGDELPALVTHRSLRGHVREKQRVSCALDTALPQRAAATYLRHLLATRRPPIR